MLKFHWRCYNMYSGVELCFIIVTAVSNVADALLSRTATNSIKSIIIFAEP